MMEKTMGRRAYPRAQGTRAILGEREKRRLMQLGACLLLFLAVFFAKGADRLDALQEDLQRALRSDVDFRAAFADLGWSLASGRPVAETMGELWVDVFMPKEKPASTALGEDGLLYQSTQLALRRRDASPAALLAGAVSRPDYDDPMAGSGAPPAAEPEPIPEPEPEPAVVYMDYTGPTLPDNTTMDRYALGLGETVTPVMAVESSPFGWRMHPLENEEKFHYGVDLASETGTTVKAFAAGTVDYIGESDVYGQYLQLDHGNGVKSFYAHCSKLCVQQGQTVAAGEKVAESGATGEVTGPHLHFELKLNGVRLNPEYYIETQS
ncbi:M23 family metallopeptidase [Vermiculatibacterium agrestimuris]|uniref:M23 family metallopeptidase n=1 Tax=Vermiculatibacterium agrestimuris TaxID=2941519 RepID=UPI00203A9C24|nr:M23 family metallopeptidase [Vermiculatibacterium agrestimuris]